LIDVAYMAVSALITSDPQHEPWDQWTRFVPRIGLLERHLVNEIPTGAIAKPLLQARCDAQLVLAAHREPIKRIVLEPEAWRNQRPREERHSEFNSLGELSLQGTLDPASLRSASPDALVRYIEPFFNAEITYGADALLTPSHLAGGYRDVAREGELRLAEAAVRLARRGGYGSRGDRARPLLVGITIDARSLGTEAMVIALARSYASMAWDGCWVQLANLTESSPPRTVSLAAAFLFALQGLSERRVYAVDCKNLVWPLLAAGLWGGCLGVGGREQFDGPQAPSPQPRKVKPTVVHPILLRSFQADSVQARNAFNAYPCECGAHDPGKVPARKPAIARHALRVRLQMTDEATQAEGVAAVRRWLTAAAWAAEELELGPPAAKVYQAVFAAAATWRDTASL
jgi:hypothetical protein